MKYLLSILFSLTCATLIAQLQRNYTSYTVDNGLAQNTVWDAFQDYKGYMWFGTADGVNRFDGYKMKHYKHSEKDSTSILGQTAFRFFETRNKQLWVSHNKGISVFNRVSDNFHNIHIFTQGVHQSDSYCYLIGEDTKGNMWCIANTKQLLCFSTTTLQKIKSIILSENEFKVLLGATKIFISGNHLVGLFTYKRTDWFRLNLETEAIEAVNGKPATVVSTMRYNQHKLCAYTDKEMVYFDIPTLRVTSRKIAGSLFPPQKSAFTAMIWWQGKIWMGNNLGLFVYDTTTNRFEEHIVSFDKKEKVGFYYVQNLVVDHSNNLWICTNGDGVKCLSPQNNKFTHLPALGGENSLIKAISVDKIGNIYSGLYSGGMLWYLTDGQTPQFKLPSQPQTHVLGLIEHNGYLYYVQNEYLMVMNLQSKRVVYKKQMLYSPEQTTIGYPVFRVYNNTVYLSADLGLFELLPNFHPRLIKQFNRGEYFLTTFEIASDTLWWVGTTRGLYMFNPVTKKMTPLPISLYTKSICLTRDRKEVWVGGNSGLYRLTPEGKQIKRYETPTDLPDDFVYGILEDKYGKLWMSHNKGLSVYRPHNNSFKHYGVKDGLQSNEFNTGAYYKDAKDLLYFGGVNGINVIDPDKIPENKNVPQIAINEILVDDLPYPFDTTYNEIRSITVSYLQNTLSFDFSALEFSQPERNMYRYKMEGYDHNWIESGTKHFIRYANLPPGEYTLKITAANGDGLWNDIPREIRITVTPPYWQTRWFYALIISLSILVFIGIILVIFSFQRSKLKRDLDIQQQLEQERIRISRDLHDNVGAQLSYLITNVEWMLQHPDQLTEEDERHRLQEMSEAGRNAILTLRQTIWAISNSSLTLEDFADRFKQFALKMIVFNKQVHLQFKETIEINSTLSPAVALHLFRICQEAFNNCLKHSQAQHITIIFYSNPQVTFGYRIEDDGVGFNWEEAKRKGHYGLLNMQARAMEAHANLSIDSAPGKGTRVTIIFTL